VAFQAQKQLKNADFIPTNDLIFTRNFQSHILNSDHVIASFLMDTGKSCQNMR